MSSLSFLRTTTGVFIALVVAVYLLIALVDPYGNVPFSLPLERAPISTNQRFSYPVLARSARFDSAIIGSSTVRLLNPANLDALTHARFVNLAMNSATAYEQAQILGLFLRHHADPQIVVIGIDDSWCRREPHFERYTFRQFPEWMYDDNRWNDLLYLFNDKALENTVRLLEFLAGKREAKYERNGFRDFTHDFGAYDPAVVAQRLYPNGRPDAPRIPDTRPVSENPRSVYAAHALLENMLAMNPRPRRTLLLFAPMHGYYLARGAANYRECKARLFAIGQRHGAGLLDLMEDSAITRNDANYWDPLHYRVSVAEAIEQSIAAMLNNAPVAAESTE